MSCYSGCHIARDHIQTDITTCHNIDETQQTYLFRPVSNRLLGLKLVMLDSNRQQIAAELFSDTHLQ